MSVVIIGGNERMICKYKQICDKFSCKSKVFTEMSGNLKSKIGTPDMVILFTSTVSHKMTSSAKQVAAKYNIPVAQCHSSSCCALNNILESFIKDNIS